MGNKFAKKKVATLQSKEKAWDNAHLLPTNPYFKLWSHSNKGPLCLSEMPAPHIFNSLQGIVSCCVNELISRRFDKNKIEELLRENLTKLLI